MRYNPKDFGAIGSGADTIAINAALAAIRTDVGGVLELDHLGGYDVGPLDATNCNRMRIEIDPQTVVRGSMMTAANQAPIFDLSFSHEVDVEGGSVFAGTVDPWNPSPPNIYPLTAFYVAGGSDKTRFQSVKMTGWFKSAALAICSAVSVTIDHCQILQRQGGGSDFGGCAPPAVCLSSNPGEWGLHSIFQTQPNLGYVNDIDFNDTEIHQVAAGPPSGWTTYLRNANHVTFHAGLSDSSHTAHMLFQGVNKEITLFAPKFYSELGRVADHIFDGVNGAVSNLRVYAPSPNGIQSACSGQISMVPYFQG